MRWPVPGYDHDQWKTWFAWHPVDVEGVRVWMEWVYRREQSTPYGSFFQYQLTKG